MVYVVNALGGGEAVTAFHKLNKRDVMNIKKNVPVAAVFALVLTCSTTIPDAHAACKPPVDFTLGASPPKDCDFKKSVFERFFALFKSFA